MLQYLFNMTMIWLISLLLFDLFLKKESYHGYNRLFLLVTFCMGIFLPRGKFPGSGFTDKGSIVYHQANTVKAFGENVMNFSGTLYNAINTETILLLIYVTGVIAGIGFTLKELFSLIQLV